MLTLLVIAHISGAGEIAAASAQARQAIDAYREVA
jgi:hypothetical protein